MGGERVEGLRSVERDNTTPRRASRRRAFHEASISWRPSVTPQQHCLSRWVHGVLTYDNAGRQGSCAGTKAPARLEAGMCRRSAQAIESSSSGRRRLRSCHRLTHG